MKTPFIIFLNQTKRKTLIFSSQSPPPTRPKSFAAALAESRLRCVVRETDPLLRPHLNVRALRSKPSQVSRFRRVVRQVATIVESSLCFDSRPSHCFLSVALQPHAPFVLQVVHGAAESHNRLLSAARVFEPSHLPAASRPSCAHVCKPPPNRQADPYRDALHSQAVFCLQPSQVPFDQAI